MVEAVLATLPTYFYLNNDTIKLVIHLVLKVILSNQKVAHPSNFQGRTDAILVVILTA